MSVSTFLGQVKEKIKMKAHRTTNRIKEKETPHDDDVDEAFPSPLKLHPGSTAPSPSHLHPPTTQGSRSRSDAFAGPGPSYFSRPWDKTHMKRWWPAHAAWSLLLLVLLVTASLALSRYFRSSGDLQRFMDTYSMSDRTVRRFIQAPHTVTGIEMHALTYEGPAVLRAVPWHTSVDAFDVSIATRRGEEVAVAMYPAHSSSDVNVTARVSFSQEYVHLKRLVMHATLDRRLEVTVRANITYRAEGKSGSAVLARNVTLDARHLGYFGMRGGAAGKSGREGGEHHGDGKVDSSATPLGTTMEQLKQMMKEKHKSMLKLESMTPTDAGFDAQMRVDLRVTRVRADLGNMRAGVWLGRHKLLTINTEASLFPFVDHFKSRVALNGGWNQTIGNSTVAELLHSVARKKGREARVPITIVGEYASEAMWLNVVTRSFRTTHRVPAEFVETVMMTAGMPIPMPSLEEANQPTLRSNATTRSTMPSSIALDLDVEE